MKPLACVLLAALATALVAVSPASARPHRKATPPPKLHIVYTEGAPVTLCAFPGTPSCGVASDVAYCPYGYTAVGGGWAAGSLINSTATYNGPNTAGNGWLVIMANLGAEGVFHAIASCARLG